MRAAIFEGADGAVFPAHDEHRHLAHEGRAKITPVLEIRLETDEAPRRALEDATKLRAVVRLVLVEPVRDAGEGRVRPRAGRIGSAHARGRVTPTCRGPSGSPSASADRSESWRAGSAWTAAPGASRARW